MPGAFFRIRAPGLIGDAGAAIIHAAMLLALLVLALASSPAGAVDLAAILGPLSERVSLGAGGTWSASVENGRFVLADPETSGIVRYYDIPGRAMLQRAGRLVCGCRWKEIPARPG